jgi:hypothetical protein
MFRRRAMAAVGYSDDGDFAGGRTSDDRDFIHAAIVSRVHSPKAWTGCGAAAT